MMTKQKQKEKHEKVENVDLSLDFPNDQATPHLTLFFYHFSSFLFFMLFMLINIQTKNISCFNLLNEKKNVLSCSGGCLTKK